MARIKDTSVETVKAAATSSSVVEARTRLRKVGGRYTGLLPVPPGEDAELLGLADRGTTTASAAASAATRSRSSGRRRGSTSSARSSGSPTASTSSSSTRTHRRQPDAQRRLRDRLHALLDQAAAFYEQTLWDTTPGSPCRTTSPRAASREEVCREFRLGLSPARRRSRRRPRRRASRARSCRGRSRHAARHRLLPAAAPCSRSRTRAGGSSASRPGSSTRTIRCAAST